MQTVAVTPNQDRANTIQLGLPYAPVVDWVTASQVIHMLSGNVAIEMDPPLHGCNSILLPEKVAGRLKPDTATVLAVGDGIRAIAPGDRVCALPYDGKHFQSFEHGGYSTRNQLRMIGVSTQNEHERSRVFYGDVILAKIEGEGELARVQPINQWVLIRREPLQKTEGGLLLTDRQTYREHKAEVMSCGSRCDNVEPGDTVVYQAGGLVVDFEFGERFGFEGDPKDYALIHEDDLHCVLKAVHGQ